MEHATTFATPFQPKAACRACHTGPTLLIVIVIVALILAGFSINASPNPASGFLTPPRAVVTVTISENKVELSDDALAVMLERAIRGVPDVSDMTFATSAGHAAIMATFQPGTDPDAALRNVQHQVQTIRNTLPSLAEPDGIAVTNSMTNRLLSLKIYNAEEGNDRNSLYNDALLRVLPRITRVRGIESAMILGSRQYVMQIRLDLDRMRPWKLSASDVMRECQDASMIGRSRRLRQATAKRSQTIELLLTRGGAYDKPKRFEDCILKAKPDGSILRLKDIGEVRSGPLYPSYDNMGSNVDGPASATLVLTERPGADTRLVIEEITKTLEEIKAKPLSRGLTFQFVNDLPAACKLSRNRLQEEHH